MWILNAVASVIDFLQRLDCSNNVAMVGLMSDRMGDSHASQADVDRVLCLWVNYFYK